MAHDGSGLVSVSPVDTSESEAVRAIIRKSMPAPQTEDVCLLCQAKRKRAGQRI